ARSLRGLPCWWRTTFPATQATIQPLWLETKGLSKGQVFLNGYNLGRYFSATATGKAVGPQTRLFVPGAYLNAEGENELLIFDEHGCDPSRCKFIASETGDLD
ncbi:MAG TPA: beta galactosidase jelly roll domain-containing protein, partial [Phycisphaerales bacterium]|nr:beta galactosidase jelly roll domain-containing protein [Phycisphaerales bacterium]